MNKKGQSAFDALNSLIIPLVTIGLVLGVGLIIMAQMKDQQNASGGCCANGTQYFNDTLGVCCDYSGAAIDCTSLDTALTAGCSGTGAVQNAMNDIPGWLAIIVIVTIGGVLLALISMFRRQ